MQKQLAVQWRNAGKDRRCSAPGVELDSELEPANQFELAEGHFDRFLSLRARRWNRHVTEALDSGEARFFVLLDDVDRAAAVDRDAVRFRCGARDGPLEAGLAFCARPTDLEAGGAVEDTLAEGPR